MSRPSNENDLPAFRGGTPVRPQGPPPWPIPDEDVLNVLQAAYHDGSWGKYHGDYARRLEKALAEYLRVEFVLLCGSGTFAVELALRALKVGPGHEVILAAYDYPGNFLAVHAVGAHPVLIDLDPDNWNLCPELLPAAVSAQTRAVIVSHLHGGIVPMRALMACAKTHGLEVIEDAAQVPGAEVEGQKAGTWGDIGIWSFGGSKLLCAGRGGALFTTRPDLYQRARTLQMRGNLLCPLSELQAAVLLPQLGKLDARNDYRTQRVRTLTELLHDVPGIRPLRNRVLESKPVYYKVGFRYDAERFGLARGRFVEALRAEGIGIDEGFHGLHVGRSPRRFRQPAGLVEAGRAHDAMLVLHHPVLLGTDDDIVQVATAIRKLWQHLDLLR